MTITATSAPRMRLCRSRSSGKATAPAAIAAIRAAITRNVFMSLLEYIWAARGLVIHRHARTMAHDAEDDGAAQQQHDEWSAPNEQGLRFQRRPESHELAVAVRHEREYRVIALSGHQHLAHLPAQIDGQIGIGVGDRFFLADETAELQGDALEARLQRVIFELPVGVHGLRPGRGLRRGLSQARECTQRARK